MGNLKSVCDKIGVASSDPPTLSATLPGLIYAPNFTARIKAMRTPLIGSACPLSDGVHQALLLAPLTDVKMSLQTKKWPN